MITYAVISFLIGFIKVQLETIQIIYHKIETIKPDNEDKIINLSYQIHNFYSAIEDIFKEINKIFETDIEQNISYHKDLLLRMKLDMPGFRPAFISTEVYNILSEILRFRHMFRHAYNYTIDPVKLMMVKKNIIEVSPLLY